MGAEEQEAFVESFRAFLDEVVHVRRADAGRPTPLGEVVAEHLGVPLDTLPLLAEHAGISFRAAYMKGRGNYLCLARFGRFDQEPLFQNRFDARLYPRIRAWAQATETGDRA